MLNNSAKANENSVPNLLIIIIQENKLEKDGKKYLNQE